MPKKKYFFGKKLISNTIYLFLDWSILTFLSFFFWFIIWKTPSFNPSDIGIVATSINLIIFVAGIFNLGINNALQKLVPEIKEKEGTSGVYSLVGLSMKPILLSTVASIIILSFFSIWAPQLIKIPFYAFLISIFSIVAFSIFSFLGSILYGLQNMRWFFLTDLFQVIIKVFLTAFMIYFILFYFNGYQGYLYITPLIGVFLSYFFISFLRFNSNYIKKNKLPFLSYKKLFFYAFPAFITNLSGFLVTNGQYIILTILKNTEATGIFTVASTITTTIGTIPSILTSALFPIISVLSLDLKTKKRQGYLIGLILRYSFFLTIPLSLLIIVFSKHMVLVFSRSEFLGSTQYFPILTLAAIFCGVANIFLSNLYAMGKPKKQRDIMLISSIFFLVSSLILTYYFSALGMSLSYFLTMLIRFLLGVSSIKKDTKINFFTGGFFKVIGSSLVITIILFILKPLVRDIFTLGVLLIPFGFLYLSLLFLTKFFVIEDVKILRYFGKRMPLIGKYSLSIANFLEKRL